MSGLPGAVAIHGGQHIAIRQCGFRHLGRGGLLSDAGSQYIDIASNSFEDTSAYAISLGNVTNAMLPADKQDAHLHVFNNSVADAAVEYTGCAGIFAGYVSQMNISHNLVANVSNCGICCGWGWGAKNSMAENSITRDHVLRSNTVLKDTGSIYTLSAQPRSEIAYNYLQQQVLPFGSLYHDARSAFFHTHHNVVDGGPMWLYLQHPPIGAVHNLTVEDNWYSDGADATPGGCALERYRTGVFRCQNATSDCCRGVTLHNNQMRANGTSWPKAAQDVIDGAGLILH